MYLVVNTLGFNMRPNVPYISISNPRGFKWESQNGLIYDKNAYRSTILTRLAITARITILALKNKKSKVIFN